MESLIAKNLLLGRMCESCIYYGGSICNNTRRAPTTSSYEQNNNYTTVMFSEIKRDERGTCEYWTSS